jgi:hypothetical protein
MVSDLRNFVQNLEIHLLIVSRVYDTVNESREVAGFALRAWYREFQAGRRSIALQIERQIVRRPFVDWLPLLPARV